MGGTHHSLQIRKRPWAIWGILLLLCATEMILIQTALASHREHEPRAAAISWAIAAVVAIATAIVWRHRPSRRR